MQQSNNYVIGVTGITGSGSSTVAKILEEHRGYVIEADELAHDLVLKGNQAYEDIVKTFGKKVLSKGKEIDRKKLGSIVFNDNEKMKTLEKIIHPLVMEHTWNLIWASTAPFVVIDAPLLIESGMYKLCKSIWLVTADDHRRIERVKARDEISQEEAQQRIISRHGEDALRPHVDVIIENNDDMAELRVLVREALGKENYN